MSLPAVQGGGKGGGKGMGGVQGLVDAAYVINLDRSTARMARMAAQCASLDIPFTRVPAVDGARVTPETLKKVATPLCQKVCTPSMVGCALSHMKVWKTAAQLGHQRTLVMEDDAALEPGFVEGLRRALEDVPQDFDLLVLGCYFLCNKDRRYAWGHEFARMFVPHSLRNDRRTWGSVYVPEYFAGSHCYIVSLKGARKLMQLVPRAHYHIDMSMNHPELNIYAVTPDLAYQRDMADSTIASYSFPKTLTPLLDGIKDRKRISVAYYLDAPMGQVGGQRLNAWVVIFAGLGVLRHRTVPLAVGLLLAELLVGGDIVAPVLAYFLGWAIRGAPRMVLRRA